VVLRPEGGVWLLSNVRVRRHVELDAGALSGFLGLPEGGTEEEWIAALGAGSGWPRWRFPYAGGLFSDTSGMAPRGSESSGAGLVAALREAWILHRADGSDYAEYLSPASSIVDRFKLGTLHQALGRWLLVDERRADTWRWWHDQKFTPDGRELLPGPYRAVQCRFFDAFFGAMGLRGRRVLDYGCGNGFYTRRFAELGATATGVDASGELLAIARRNHPDLDFRQAGEAALAALPSGAFDLVYVGDVLALLWEAPPATDDGSEGQPRVRALLREFRRLLGADGKLCLMEPNATFWPAVRLGSAGRPFTLCAEYRHRVHRVAPTVEEIVGALSASGFAVLGFHHPAPEPNASELDPGTASFAQEFPLWDFYVCAPSTPGEFGTANE